MTRGTNNERLPVWLQDFAEMNQVTVDPNTEIYERNSIYRVNYRSEELILEERGHGDEIAVLLSGDEESLSELAEKAGYEFDERYPRGVLVK